MTPKTVQNSLTGATPSAGTLRCENLRPGNGDLLVAAVMPGEIPVELPEGGRLVAAVDHPALGTVGFFDRIRPETEGLKERYGYAILSSPTPAVKILGEAPRNIRQAILSDHSTILLLSDDAVHRIAVSSGDSPVQCAEIPSPEPPQMVFSIGDSVNYTADIGRRRLSGTYPNAVSALSPSDARAIVAQAVRTASAQMDANAFVGRFAQSVMARCRFLDAAGRTVCITPPQLVAPPAGPSFTSVSGHRISDDGRECYGGQMNVSAFTLNLAAPTKIPGHIYDRIEEMEVEVSAPLHTVDYRDYKVSLNERPAGRVDVRFSPTGPAAGRGEADCGLRRVVETVLAAPDTLAFTAVKRIRRPLDTEGATWAVKPSPAWLDDYAAQCDAIKSMPSKTQVHSDIDTLCSLPNGFAAATAVKISDAIYFGGITPLITPLPSPAAFLTGVEETDGPANAWVEVQTSSRMRRFVSSCRLDLPDSPAPGSIRVLPLIALSIPDAVRLSLWVVAPGGTLHHIMIPLQSSPCGRYAWHVTPDGLPEPLIVSSAVRFQHPTVVYSEKYSFPGGIIGLSGATGKTVAASAEAIAGEIHALHPSVRAASAWESSRSRAMLFASDGVHMLTVSGNSTAASPYPCSIALDLIDSRPIVSHRSVAPTPGTGFAAAAVAGGVLTLYRSGKVFPLSAPHNPLSEVGFDPVNNDLWLLDPALGQPVLFPGCCNATSASTALPEGHFHFSAITASRLFSTPSLLIAETDDALLLSTARPSPQTLTVDYLATIPVPDTSRQRLTLSVDMVSSAPVPQMSLLSPSGQTLCSINLSKAFLPTVVRSIIVPPTVSHPSLPPQNLKIRLHGPVSPGFRLGKMELK